MPPSSGCRRREFECVLCRKRTKAKERRPINQDIANYLNKTFLITATNSRDVLCNRCRQQYYVKEKNKSCEQVETSILHIDRNSDHDDDDYRPPVKRLAVINSPPTVSLPIPSTAKSHAYCFVCRKPKSKLIVVPSEARFSAFLRKEIIIPSGSRCCSDHLINNKLTHDAMLAIECKKDNVLLNRSAVFELLRSLRLFALQTEKSRIYFDSNDALSSSDFVNLTGITKDNFNELYTYIQDLVRNTPVRSARTSLGLYLFKLKSGISNKVLSTVFNITKSSIRRAVSSVRTALTQSFVRHNLGLSHISRQEIIQHHTRPIAQTLFGNISNTQAILVLDGTYVYIQKSGNFTFQRRTYSIHKGRPLVKPMIVVSTTGYFITVLGPYFADSKNNDAFILKHIMKNNIEDIKRWVEENDVFIVDRGFRDSLDMLKDLGIKSEMPCFIKKGQKQMTTEDANASRLVTKIRWVVESANARIKRWAYLGHVLPTNQVPYIGDDVRIVCAISNKYLPPLSSGGEDDVTLGARMVYLSKQINDLKIRIETENLERKRAVWQEPDMTILNFPHLDEVDLRNITCGSYQLKLCPTYVQEHTIDGNFDIFVHSEYENLIRVKIQSRHVSSRQYLLWIEFSPISVTAWYCKCKAGARVVGVCAHIASVLWYLGYARHNPNMRYGTKNWGEYVVDASDVPESIDSSSESDNIVEE